MKNGYDIEMFLFYDDFLQINHVIFDNFIYLFIFYEGNNRIECNANILRLNN